MRHNEARRHDCAALYGQRAGDWGGFRVGELIELDLGRGLAPRPHQGAARRYAQSEDRALGVMRNEQVGIVERDDPKAGKRFRFHCAKGV